MSQLLPIRFQEHLQVCIFRYALLIFGDTLQKFQNTPLVLHSEQVFYPETLPIFGKVFDICVHERFHERDQFNLI